jgi:hypothetical protein
MEIEYLDQPYELVYKPLPMHLQGLWQTSSGYGSKLVSSRCVRLSNGITRRVYVTCYSNTGSAWIVLDKKRLYLRD